MRLSIAFWALLLTASAGAETITGQVVAVADGDSLTILDARSRAHKIRLAGIDAPERRQPFGDEAKRSLSGLAFSRQAAVDVRKRDRYGRALGAVVVEGSDVNAEQIRRGMAWHFKRYESEQSASDRARYAQAEADARRERRGLWAHTSPVPPWDWRRSKRN